MSKFQLVSAYPPAGDQVQAIEKLTKSIELGSPCQTLMGVTGSGKTFTMANIIAQCNRPTLVVSHNKTLAAQLASEFRDFFPHNAVEYFVSYYDFYQPEAYIAASDTYIEKDSAINSEIDRLRHSTTQSVLERRDVVVVASVSCIYGLGSPDDYQAASLIFRKGHPLEREYALEKLVHMQYGRNNLTLSPGEFRVKGEVLEIFPVESEEALRVQFWGDEVEKIYRYDALTGEIKADLNGTIVYPAKHFVTPTEKLEKAYGNIQKELDRQIRYFQDKGKILEAERIRMRTSYDLEMMRETGYCQGIENYSRHFTERLPGEPPYTLIDYFPPDFLLLIDESHVTLPQIRAMHHGDRSRKDNLVAYGFRLPSAYDNRPLRLEEFEEKTGQTVYVSATPGSYELDRSTVVAEQIIRPTGLTDPEIIVKPAGSQVLDLLEETRTRAEKNERVLVTTLTKKMAEDLAAHMAETGIKVRYLHSEIDTLERIKILQELRTGVFDCLVGVNLLREGLDLPEVSLVAILDADKEGFLRSETSLIQTIGRAARNSGGTVIMYGDNITGSMRRAIDETNRRRAIQLEYNKQHNIVPATIRKAVKDILAEMSIGEKTPGYEEGYKSMTHQDLKEAAAALEKLMKEAASNLEFEKAAAYRDEMLKLKTDMRKKEKKAMLLPD